MSKPLVLSTLMIDENTEKPLQLLEKHFTVKYWNKTEFINPRNFILENVKGAFGILCRGVDGDINAEVLDAAGDTLKVVSPLSAGYNHIDVNELRRRCVRIGSTPEVGTAATAEMAVTLLLATSRRLNECYKVVHNGLWKKESMSSLLCSHGLEGSTVGIVGCGRIGLSVIKKLKSFDIKHWLYHSRSEKPEATALGGELKSVDELVKESDFIVLTAALNEDTRHIINKERINLMKPNAIIVNIGHGALIDQSALTEALLKKKIYGAGLDVTDPEPIEANDPLLQMDNVVITPHIGGATFTALAAKSDLAVRNIIAVFEGKEMPAEIK